MARVNKKRILKNYIYLLLDSSQSMDTIQVATMKAANSLFESFRYPPKGQKNLVSLLYFGGEYLRPPEFQHAAPENIPQITYSNYRPDGMTPMLDAIGYSIGELEKIPFDEDTSRLILCITDGDENKSRIWNRFLLQQKLRRLDDSWTITLQVPRGRKARACAWGIPEDNVQEWEQTDEGTRETFAQTQDAMSNFYQQRTTGQRSSKSFFAKVQSNVPDNAKRLLKDLSKSFREYKVVGEDTIRPFVEAKTGKDYERGNAYYLLMKPETVQPNKEVLIKEKGAKAVYGGPQARDLIGLPVGEYAKVDPGNHGNYDVFVQSRSVNRILPRGTKVLVRV